MWPFTKKPDRAGLHGYKKVRVNGFNFTIRKINPIMDFTPETMPQIFTDFVNRSPLPEKEGHTKLLRSARDMGNVLVAGVVDPPLKGKDTLLAVEDLLSDLDTAQKLYWEIVIHSLNKFRGLRGIFFSARLRLYLSMLSRKDTESSQAKSPSMTVN